MGILKCDRLKICAEERCGGCLLVTVCLKLKVGECVHAFDVTQFGYIPLNGQLDEVSSLVLPTAQFRQKAEGSHLSLFW